MYDQASTECLLGGDTKQILELALLLKLNLIHVRNELLDGSDVAAVGFTQLTDSFHKHLSKITSRREFESPAFSSSWSAIWILIADIALVLVPADKSIVDTFFEVLVNGLITVLRVMLPNTGSHPLYIGALFLVLDLVYCVKKP